MSVWPKLSKLTKVQDSRLFNYLIREIKTWLNINHITVHNNTYFIFQNTKNSYWKYKSYIMNKLVIHVIYTHTHNHLLWRDCTCAYVSLLYVYISTFCVHFYDYGVGVAGVESCYFFSAGFQLGVGVEVGKILNMVLLFPIYWCAFISVHWST